MVTWWAPLLLSTLHLSAADMLLTTTKRSSVHSACLLTCFTPGSSLWCRASAGRQSVLADPPTARALSAAVKTAPFSKDYLKGRSSRAKR